MSMQMIASLHVRWQIYNEYLLDGGEPIELARWELLPSETKPAPYAQPASAYAPPPGGYGQPPGGYTPPPGGYTPPQR